MFTLDQLIERGAQLVGGRVLYENEDVDGTWDNGTFVPDDTAVFEPIVADAPKRRKKNSDVISGTPEPVAEVVEAPVEAAPEA